MELTLKKEIISNKTICRIIGVTAFVILTTLGAFIRIPLPFTPVPITLQTFFVLLSGAFLGSRLGATAQISYMALGVSGLSLFTSSGSGLLYILGPTGGYILGFVVAAIFIGKFIKYANNFFYALAVFCAADIILLGCGTLWLKILFNYSLAKSLFIGFLPFLAGDLFKAILACAVYSKLQKRIKEIF